MTGASRKRRWPWSQWIGKQNGEILSHTTIFARLRHQLFFWYTGVLALTLLAWGIIYALCASQLLLQPVRAALAAQALQIQGVWRVAPDRACEGLVRDPELPVPSSTSSPPLPGPVQGDILLEGSIVLQSCYDVHGNLLGSRASRGAPVPSSFLNNDLVSKAMQTGQASDTIDGGSDYGRIYRYAVIVQDFGGNDTSGVVQVGVSIAHHETILHLLNTLSGVLGLLTLLFAGIGGLILAERALAPARLAAVRQQAFLADASHELRTPLALLRANAEMLLRKREQFDPADAKLLEDIVFEAEHMTALASRMLLLARLDAGKIQYEQVSVHLGEIAAHAVHRAQALASQKQVRLLVGQSEPVERLCVLGDQMLLEQAIMIVLENAIKYNRQGGRVEVHTSLEGKEVHLEIRDTGIGIAPEDLPHVGERFYRAERARASVDEGVGLGLAIARSTAVLHRGTLTVQSTPGQGTVVMLIFPFAG